MSKATTETIRTNSGKRPKLVDMDNTNPAPSSVLVVPEVRAVRTKSSLSRKSLGELREHLLAAYEPTRSGVVKKVQADAEFGAVWNRIKEELKARSLPIQKWVDEGNLPFTQQYANSCGRLALKIEKFQEAHDWYRQSGIEMGWRVRKNTGCEYGLEVIALYEKSRTQDTPETPASEKAQGKKETATQKLKRLEAEAKALLAALEALEGRYRTTQEGADYRDPVLHSVRAARMGEDTNAAPATPPTVSQSPETAIAA